MKKLFEKKNSEDVAVGRGTHFWGMLMTGAVFCLLIFVLIKVSDSLSYVASKASLELIDTKSVVLEETIKPSDTLVLYEDEVMGLIGLEDVSEILSQMKVGYDVVECEDFENVSLDNYRKIVISVTHYQNIGEKLSEIKAWVRDGGNLMILYPPDVNGPFSSLFDVLGIKDCGTSFAYVDALEFTEGFMIGATNGRFEITDPYESSMNALIDADCEVFLKSDEDYPVPVIWRRNYGEGVVVVDNFGIFGKSYRGIHSSAYSLLDENFIYPVINASVFYIDDFPSPVPEGSAEYIERDYGMTIRDFYTSRWWTDIYNLAAKYDIRYTGLVIEQYSDQISGVFERNTDDDRYHYFGNMLLEAGGEIGFHGYNHMPLVLENFDYMNLYDSYVQWPSIADIRNSLIELKGFCEELFPDLTFQVYVPPSNIISDEGIAVLASDDFDVKTIASLYIPGEGAYAQEFKVEDNGIISCPRIISGYVLEKYSRLMALSEINFHFVNTHFQHPDDVLDEDRGAALGWNTLFGNLSDYVDWLYRSAPTIRNLTGSEAAAAVQRYDYIDFVRTETEDGFELELSNFHDEAWFILRINNGQGIESVEGGEFMPLEKDIYLINAQSKSLKVTLS